MFSLRGAPVATTENAIIHAMGQLQDMGQVIETSDIAALLECQKATARRWLERMVERKVLYKLNVIYRKNATKAVWRLPSDVYDRYQVGYYRYAYYWLMVSKGVMS